MNDKIIRYDKYTVYWVKDIKCVVEARLPVQGSATFLTAPWDQDEIELPRARNIESYLISSEVL